MMGLGQILLHTFILIAVLSGTSGTDELTCFFASRTVLGPVSEQIRVAERQWYRTGLPAQAAQQFRQHAATSATVRLSCEQDRCTQY
jgi:hypothetical protein